MPISKERRNRISLTNNFHKREKMNGLLQTWLTSQIHFIILTCSNDQVDHPFPADGITVFDRGRCFDRVAIQQMVHFVIIRPSNVPLPPPSRFSTPSLWKLVDKRCAIRQFALPPFHWFNLLVFFVSHSPVTRTPKRIAIEDSKSGISLWFCRREKENKVK